ncbi:MAG: hypothetical protein IJ071_07705 [Ruminococcus sp.]|nr:hypothetical protein [Ruminococcus sp.]
MIRAELHFGEGHYRVMSKNRGRPFLKAAFYGILVAVSLGFLIKLSFDLLRYHAWSLWLYTAVFIAVNGYTLVKLMVLIIGAKKHVIKELSANSYSLVFDEEQVVFCYDAKAEFGEKHLKYPAVQWADRRGEWFLIRLKEDELVFSASEITEGSAQELCALLAEKLGDRFKDKGEAGK